MLFSKENYTKRFFAFVINVRSGLELVTNGFILRYKLFLADPVSNHAVEGSMPEVEQIR